MADLIQKKEDCQKDTAQIVPVTQHILDSYTILSPLEKRQLWKMVMKKATAYRSQEDVLTVIIYPNLPK